MPKVHPMLIEVFEKNPSKGINPVEADEMGIDQLSPSARSILIHTHETVPQLILNGPRTGCAPYQGLMEERALDKSEYT